MRRAGMRVVVILRSRIREMMDQVRARHHKQCEEQQHRTERTETTTSPAPLQRAWKGAASHQESLGARQSRDAQ